MNESFYLNYLKSIKITIDICTRNRYNILCDTLLAILNQTYLHLIDEIIIYDDNLRNNRIDLRNISIYNFIFNKLNQKNIKWHVIFGKGRGQVLGHQWIKDNAKNDFIWRLDDDQFPENDVLEGIIKTYIDENCNRTEDKNLIISYCIPFFLSSIVQEYKGCNLIKNYKFYNSQWIKDSFDKNKIEYAQHIYSSFFYNRKKTLDYCLDLSPVGHREETIFTYRNFKHNATLILNKNCIVWHKQIQYGGIRSGDIYNKNNFEHDEKIADRIIKNLIDWNGEKIFPIIGGIGDNYAFRSSFENNIEKLKNKFENDIIIATSFKDVYEDMGVNIISIQDAKDILSDRVVNNYNVYSFMSRNNWNKTIVEAYKKMFEI